MDIKTSRQLYDHIMQGKIVDTEFAGKVATLANTKSWRPDITDLKKRVVAAAINFAVSGKAGKKTCIDNYLRTGFVPLFQGCRKNLAEFGLVPQEYTSEEKAYHQKGQDALDQKRAKAAQEEVDEECRQNRGK